MNCLFDFHTDPFKPLKFYMILKNKFRKITKLISFILKTSNLPTHKIKLIGGMLAVYKRFKGASYYKMVTTNFDVFWKYIFSQEIGEQ